jgi:hypothetical protein
MAKPDPHKTINKIATSSGLMALCVDSRQKEERF